ncbi:MAG: 5'/3'-nucleotidase SurE [Elainellaceae cyanobacterium]
MVFVLTNDDGIDAPGLRSLQKAVGDHAVIVAPKHHYSGCGHQVTTHQPIHVEERAPGEFAVDGTPADCTRVALRHLYPEVKWVISGINAGGNLGSDVYTSGTVAAVREATFHRIPGIAISQYIHKKREIDWELATRLAMRVLEHLLTLPLEAGSFWNVNLPHLDADTPEPKIVFCHLCTQPLPVAYRLDGNHLYYIGDYNQRARDPGSDVETCFSGNIAVTQMRI